MTPNRTSAALAMLASTGRPMATSESFMPPCVLSETILYRYRRTRHREIDKLPVGMETHGNAARFHVGSKAKPCSRDFAGPRASRLISPVRMNGIERGAQALNMVTAHESSPARRPGARALAALALTLGGCLSNPPGVRGVAGTAPAPNVFWTPPQQRAPRDTTQATPSPSPSLSPDLAQRAQAPTRTDTGHVAQRNHTATAAAWADARAAAATYGAARGQYYPTVELDVNATAVKTAATAGRISVHQRLYGPTFNASWMVFDFGALSGSFDGALVSLL